jgi:TRAP transporter TAXI family solute receptor
MRTLGAVGLVFVLVTGVVSGCGGRRDTAETDTGGEVTCQVTGETRVGIATGNVGGVYYTMGNAFAEQVATATGGTVKATAAETGASVQNIQQLVAGTYAVAFSLADTAADAVNGTGAFTSPQPVAALARIHTNYTQVVVRTSSGITDVASMRGKRISTGSPKSGTEVIANRLLTAAGLNAETDIQAQRLDLTKTVDGVKDGSIDGFFWSGGLPTPNLTDLFTTSASSVRFLDITPLLPAMQQINPVYEQGAIAASVYALPADVQTIVVPNYLLVKNDLDADVACALTKALFERKDQIAQAAPAAAELSVPAARNTTPVPLHRGAAEALTLLGG